MPRSKASYQKAARKAAATRKANAEFAKRSAAAIRGWATRRTNAAQSAVETMVRSRPTFRGQKLPNLYRGKPVPYSITVFGSKTPPRYDFRGLSEGQARGMRERMFEDAIGHYVRMLVVTDSEAAYRALTTSGSRGVAEHIKGFRSGKPFYFWTSRFGPVESSLELYQHILPDGPDGGLLGSERGTVKILIVEVL